jgi:N-methylhydantoinase A
VSYHVAVDVGGTFTDAVASAVAGAASGGPPPGGPVRHVKVTTDPADASLSVMLALERLAAECGLELPDFLARTGRIVHGTTLGLNALLQGARVRVGLLTTEGFRDSLEFRRSAWSDQWDFRAPAPPLLVPRRWRLGIPERVDAQGELVRPLDAAAVAEAARRLQAGGVEAVAVCFLFSFLRPEHEVRAAAILRRLLPGVFVSASHEVAPRVREYERTSTTVINAYLGPLFERYLSRLEGRLAAAGWQGEFRLMSGSGGCLDREEVRSAPGRVLLSGPAGGALGASRLADMLGEPALLAGDMGGTSFDVCTVQKREVALRAEGEVNGLPVMAPLLAVDSVGAGGGSLAALDSAGLLRVGPESAGAHPGPAAFGEGGMHPTLTDALVTLGLLGSEAETAAPVALDGRLAAAAVEEGVGRPLGLDVLEAARSVVRVAVAGVADALRLEAAAQAVDPRRTPLLAVGGAFPPLAAYVARDLGAQRVLVPEEAASFCAAGMLAAEDRFDLAAPWLCPGAEVSGEGLARALAAPLAGLRRRLERIGAGPGEARLLLAAQARYRGQHHELDLPLGEVAWAAQPGASLDVVAARLGPLFHRRHEEVYGYAEPERAWEVVGLRVSAAVPARETWPTVTAEAERPAAGGPPETPRATVFWLDDGPLTTSVCAPAQVTEPIPGPLLIDLGHTMLAVPPGFTVERRQGVLELRPLEQDVAQEEAGLVRADQRRHPGRVEEVAISG